MKKFLISLAAALLALSAGAQSFDSFKFTDAEALPLYGKCSPDTYKHYTRLPTSFEGVSREPVWWLGQHSAGLFIRFSTDAPQVAVRWQSTFFASMNHMTDTGTRGVDLYYLSDEGWRFAGAGRPNTQDKVTTSMLVKDAGPIEREYMLYLALYDGVDKVEIGVPAGYTVSCPRIANPTREKPIVMYGTSIMQGCSASRPGMAYTNIISRKLGREVMNLGFSGNGQLDYEIAELMASVPDPGVYVMDNVPNCSIEQIEQRTEAFVKILRDAHPDVPIIFVEDPIFSDGNLNKAMITEFTTKNAAQRAVYEKMVAAGMKNTCYVWANELVGNEDFVDGIHFTDVGMVKYADMMIKKIECLVK